MALQVDKKQFDEQARFLLRHNYVYKKRAKYRADLVKDFPADPAVPSCLEACAKFVPTAGESEDSTRAQGPASSTTGAQLEQEAMAQDEAMLTEWLSIVDDQLDDFAEVTSILALQGPLERMESLAGRVMANELSIIIEGASNARLDDVGRCRLKRLCEEFLSFCIDRLCCLLTQSDAVTARPSFNFETSTFVPEEITHAMPLSFSPHAAKEDWVPP